MCRTIKKTLWTIYHCDTPRVIFDPLPYHNKHRRWVRGSEDTTCSFPTICTSSTDIYHPSCTTNPHRNDRIAWSFHHGYPSCSNVPREEIHFNTVLMTHLNSFNSFPLPLTTDAADFLVVAVPWWWFVAHLDSIINFYARRIHGLERFRSNNRKPSACFAYEAVRHVDLS